MTDLTLVQSVSRVTFFRYQASRYGIFGRDGTVAVFSPSTSVSSIYAIAAIESVVKEHAEERISLVTNTELS
jgi:hypothetical protein